MRLLIYVNKKMDLKIDPCRTPSHTGSQEDDWPFRSTLSNLSFRILLMRIKGQPDTLMD